MPTEAQLATLDGTVFINQLSTSPRNLDKLAAFKKWLREAPDGPDCKPYFLTGMDGELACYDDAESRGVPPPIEYLLPEPPCNS